MKASRFRYLAGMVMLGLLLAAGVQAQTNAVDGLLDRAAVIAAARTLTAEAYPNCDDVVVDEVVRAVYKADGTDVTWDDEYVKVLTEKGKRDGQNIALHFSQAYEGVEIARLEVIKADGTIVPVDVARQSRVMVDESQMDSNIYDPNQKILQATVPGLEVGDVRHTLLRRETRKSRVPNTWSDHMVFEYTTPYRRLRYEVLGPRELPLTNIALRAEIPGTVTFNREATADGWAWRWDVRDVPRMYSEPNMPPLYTVVQRLLVSTIPDWPTVSRWYWNLCRPHLEATTPEMKTKVSELTGGLTDRRQKIERVFQFVSQQIRYMGITTETEAPGYEPHDVKVTFENRYGVCRDKAALLAAMLRLADIPAYPVIINVGPKKDLQIPNPYFNHAVVAAEDGAGGYILMDPTDENTVELFPAYLGNLSYLVAHPDGDPLRTSPVVPAEENLLRIRSTGRLDAQGTLTVESRLEFAGINDNAYRGYFAGIKPEERRRFFEGRVKDRLPGARLTAFELVPEDMQNTSVPLRATFTCEAPDFPVVGEEYAMLPLPWLGTGIGYANFVLGQTGLEKRKYPLFTRIACGIEETFELDTGAALAAPIALPEYVPIQTNTLVFQQSLTSSSNRLAGTSRFLLKAVEFDPAEYLVLKQALKDIEYALRKKPVFHAPPAAARDNDVRIVSEDTAVELRDARHWTVVQTVCKQVLTYAGKKDNAELKFAYNPAWSDVAIERAAVTGPDGKTLEAGKAEINLMDAGWVGSAPRYPAEKVLVVSLPGVEIGSRIEYRVRQTFRDVPFFSLNGAFGGFDPVDAASLRIDAPRGLALAIEDRTGGRADVRTTTEGDRTVYAWTAKNLAPLRREEALPPAWEFMPAVLVSAGTWDAYAREVGAALARASAGQAKARQAAEEAVAGCRDEWARVKAIRDAVARSVRPTGPTLAALPLSAITPADRTLAEGYGFAADRAVVLHAMLEAAGFKPRFVLAASNGPRAEALRKPKTDCPQRDHFNTVLVCLPVGGRDVFLNDSDQYGELGTTPHEERPMLTLDGTPGTVAPLPELNTWIENEYRVDLADNGDALITATRTYYGAEFGSFHKRFAELPPEERNRFYLEMIARLSQAAEPQGDLVTDYAAFPGRQTFTVRVPRFAVRDGRYLYVTLPGLADDVFRLRSDRRENPWFRDEPLKMVVRLTVGLPPSAKAVNLQPETLAWTGPAGLGTITQTVDLKPGCAGGQVIEIVRSIDLKETVVPAADYPSLLSIDRKLKHPAMRTILVSLP